MTKLSTWVAVASFVAFCAFSVKVKMDVAQAEAFDSFEGRMSYGDLPPEFELIDLDGTTRTLDQLIEEGQVGLVNFWATWCVPCRLELPMLERLHERYYEDGLRIVAINVGEDEVTVGPFVRARPVSFPVLLDTDRAVATRYRIDAIPTTLLLDDQGNVVDVTEGLDPYLGYRIETFLDRSETREF